VTIGLLEIGDRSRAEGAASPDLEPLPDGRRVYCLAQGGYLFPGAHSIGPDYTGLWIGIMVAVLGVIVLLAGIILASTLPTFLKLRGRRR
jgi:hypothetical protein